MIWNKRYYDSKYGLEPQASFKYFKMYLKQDGRRSIKELYLKLQNDTETKVGKYKTLTTYSFKWKWLKRAKEYDKYVTELREKETQRIIINILYNQMHEINKRFNIINKNLDDIIKSGVPIEKQTKLILDNTKCYSMMINTLFTIKNKRIKDFETQIKQQSYIDYDKISKLTDDYLKK